MKLAESLTSRFPPGQVDPTVKMNGHSQRFQSVGMVELLGINNSNGKFIVGQTPTTVRAMILSHSHTDNSPTFLSITRKKNSTIWQGTYILQQAGHA